jgi:hypothetical protein
MIKTLSRYIGERATVEKRYFERYKLSADARQAFVQSADRGSLVQRLFLSHLGRSISKWTHYLPVYERYFSPFRERAALKFLEIGVLEGGSLELWRKYFGPEATIFGIDVNPACATRVSAPNQVRIGSQDDANFLTSVVGEMGGLDIVLDDGSHIGRHQRASFETLFPLLSYGGLYVIEDLHTSYWQGPHEGGYRKRGTGIEYLKQIIDDMHGWYHERATTTGAKESVGAMHIYDSIAIIEKSARQEPAHVRVG